MSDPHAGEPQLLPTTTLVLRYGYSSVSTYSAVSQLPDELLQIIFCYFRLAHKLDDRSSSLRVLGQDDTLAWTVVLHVCRHWRRAAYQCSEFWERIPLSSAKWAKVALEYSKPRTIIVEWKSGSGVLGEGYISVPAVLLALKELPRIRVLSLKELSFTIHEGHETRWGLSPAIVQDLREGNVVALDVSHLIDPPRLSVGPSAVQILDGKLSPNLQILHLHRVSIAMCVRCMHAALVSLTLENCDIWKSNVEVYDAFSNLPSLETLSLVVHAAPAFIPGPKDGPQDTIRLRRLRDLSISGHWRFLPYLLVLFSIPEEAGLQVRFWGSELHFLRLSRLAAAIMRNLSSRSTNGGRVAFQHLSVAGNLEEKSRLCHWTASQAISAPGAPSRLGPVQISPLYIHDHLHANRYTARLFHHLSSITAFVELEVASEAFAEPLLWIELAKVAKDAEQIVIRRETRNATSFISLLLPQDRPRGGAFSSLRTLHVRECTLLWPRLNWDPKEVFQEDLTQFESAPISCPPLEIGMEKCSVESGTILELRKKLGTDGAVVWDGITVAPTSQLC